MKIRGSVVSLTFFLPPSAGGYENIKVSIRGGILRLPSFRNIPAENVTTTSIVAHPSSRTRQGSGFSQSRDGIIISPSLEEVRHSQRFGPRTTLPPLPYAWLLSITAGLQQSKRSTIVSAVGMRPIGNER